MLLKLHTKLAPGLALTQINFDPIQEIGPKVGGGPFFARLRYVTVSERNTKRETKTVLGGTIHGHLLCHGWSGGTAFEGGHL